MFCFFVVPCISYYGFWRRSAGENILLHLHLNPLLDLNYFYWSVVMRVHLLIHVQEKQCWDMVTHSMPNINVFDSSCDPAIVFWFEANVSASYQRCTLLFFIVTTAALVCESEKSTLETSAENSFHHGEKCYIIKGAFSLHDTLNQDFVCPLTPRLRS